MMARQDGVALLTPGDGHLHRQKNDHADADSEGMGVMKVVVFIISPPIWP